MADLVTAGVSQVRTRLGDMLFERVAGPDGPQNRDRIHNTPGPRWFGPDRPILAVHGDAAMFIGGLRALLLQSLHPLAMAGVAGHSGYRGDPWGRLARTSTFLAVTTYGTAEDAEAMIERVRGVHERVHGRSADGRPYSASDPHLLRWVHIAEIDSFLRSYQQYGTRRLDAADRNAYIADTARTARALGVTDPPMTEIELDAQLQAYRPELAGTAEARAAARYLLLHPPLPLLARAPYAGLASAAVALLPVWARWPLRLPYLPIVEPTLIRATGMGITAGIRWAMTPAPSAGPRAGN